MEKQFQNPSQLSTVSSPQGLWRNVPSEKGLELPGGAQGRAHSACMAGPEAVTSKCFPACARAQQFQLSSSPPPWEYFQPRNLTAAPRNMLEGVSSLLRTPAGEFPEPRPAWPRTLPGIQGQPQLLWATCARASAPSQGRIPSQYPIHPCLVSGGSHCPLSCPCRPLAQVPLQLSCSPFMHWKGL